MVFIITEDIQLEQLQSPQITINILFPKFNSVLSTMSFKILNDVTLDPFLDL